MARKKISEFELVFTGLSDGKHELNFHFTNQFFHNYPNSIIDGGDINVLVVLDKSETLITADFEIKGNIKVSCDRCGDPFDLQVKGKEALIYKFTDELIDDEKIRTIRSSDYKIDFSQPVYEFTVCLKPARTIHTKGKCNQEMLDAIDQYLMVPGIKAGSELPEAKEEKDKIDPRWDKLKGLNFE